jgi:hypothetical protein
LVAAQSRADDERRHRQLDRPGQDVHHLLDDGPARHQRHAPVADERAAEEGGVLRDDRPVQPQPLPERRDGRRVRLVAEDHQRRIARQDADDREDDGQDGEERDERETEPADEERRHGVTS